MPRIRSPECSSGPSAPVLHFNSTSVVLWFMQFLLLLAISQTAGVTHWKLTDNDIIPDPSNLDSEEKSQSETSSDLHPLKHLSTPDPELELLVRYSARNSGGLSLGSLNRGAGGRGVSRRHMTSSGSCYSSGSADGGGEGGRGRGREREGVELGESEGSGNGLCHQEQDRERGEPRQPRNPDGSGPMSASEMANAHPAPLTCGDPVEYTVYDFLKGIARRKDHKPFPEPEVAMIFKKSEMDNTVDLFDVEMGLKKAYQENPKSLTVLNQIGNFWRIKGNTQLAIECFRKALFISSDHPDLLLNLARVLFNLKFYDDAVFLAKRSLHMKSSDSHAWLQYFTLGEVYKALEKYEEAALYFKKSLEKNPGLHVAEMHLHELGLDHKHSVNAYTLLIIFALIFIVMVMIYYLIGAMST